MILWLPNRYNQLQSVPKGIDGILFDMSGFAEKFYNAHKSELPNTVLLVGESYSAGLMTQYSEIKSYYIDESIVNGRYNYHSFEQTNPLITFGEPDRDYLLQYKDCKCGVTYTAYREYWKIFGLRIPEWFGLIQTNQISTWEFLQSEFGDRFKMCWISIDKNKSDYQKLIQWAKTHNKQIGLFIEDNVSVEQAIKEVEKL